MWIDDQVLEKCSDEMAIELWVPESSLLVLGRSNKASREVHLAHCAADGVPVFKRLGGGGTVVLYPGCLIVSVGCWVADFYKNDHYFRQLNQAVIQTLKGPLPELVLEQRGHSDIVAEGRKCAGTSLFRSRNYLLYQASILVDLDLEAIERYLPHPSAEPDYRQGRRHRDFLFGLGEHSPLTPHGWREVFACELRAQIEKALEADLIEPKPEQVPHVRSRIGELHPLE